MGKGGVVLGLIGLLLGAGGLGIGFINFMNQPIMYYDYRDTDYMPSPAGVYIPIPDLSIVFEIGVVVLSERIGNFIREASLWIQSYNA